MTDEEIASKLKELNDLRYYQDQLKQRVSEQGPIGFLVVDLCVLMEPYDAKFKAESTDTTAGMLVEIERLRVVTGYQASWLQSTYLTKLDGEKITFISELPKYPGDDPHYWAKSQGFTSDTGDVYRHGTLVKILASKVTDRVRKRAIMPAVLALSSVSAPIGLGEHKARASRVQVAGMMAYLTMFDGDRTPPNPFMPTSWPYIQFEIGAGMAGKLHNNSQIHGELE